MRQRLAEFLSPIEFAARWPGGPVTINTVRRWARTVPGFVQPQRLANGRVVLARSGLESGPALVEKYRDATKLAAAAKRNATWARKKRRAARAGGRQHERAA